MKKENTYSDEKLNSSDEGDLKIKCFIEKGRVILDFGKDLSWIGFDKNSLISFVEGLKSKLEQL